MGIEAIIFDLGGVIMRTEDQAPRADLAKRLGLSYRDLATQVFDGPESRRAQLGEMTAQAFWDGASATHKMPSKDFVDSFFRGDQIDQVLIENIRKLRTKYKTGLLSNAFSDLRYWIEEEWKFADAFVDMVISAEVKMAKPDPAIYAHALRQLDVQPSATVFVDDLPVNVEAAEKIGMHGILFKSRDQALLDLNDLLGKA